MTAGVEARNPLDIDLFGLLRIRLHDAHPRHVEHVARLFGAELQAAEGDAHLSIHFDGPRPAEELVVLAGPDAGVVDGEFVLLRGDGRVHLPLDTLDERATIRCSEGVDALPQLVPIVNAIFVGLGILPLHASTVELDGVGVAIAGWSKGGKTEALLALMSAGGTPIADEWTYVDPTTRMAHGGMGPVRLTANHLGELRALRAQVPPRRRARMAVGGAASGAYRSVPLRLWRGLRPLRWIHRFAAPMESLAGTEVSLDRLGGSRQARQVRLDRIVLVVSGEGEATTRSTIDAPSAAERMVAAHMHHRLGLLELYETFRFCRPNARSQLLESLEQRERTMLRELFGDREVTVITHPHPASIPPLRTVLVRALEDGP